MSDFVVGDVVLIGAVVRDGTPTPSGELWVDFLGGGRYVPVASIVENKGQPVPDEPPRYGALVKDRDGDVWVRDSYGGWILIDGSSSKHPATWVVFTSQYGPVTVLFNGVDAE